MPLNTSAIMWNLKAYGVLSHTRDGVGHLLDADKPHFAAWIRMLRSRFGNEYPQRSKVTPLHHVAQYGYRSLVDYLISKRPEDVNFRGEYGTPLHAALGGGHPEVAQVLLGHCEDVDVRDYEERTPLHLAADHGLLAVTRELVERHADINSRDNLGRTPLFRAVAMSTNYSLKGGHVDVARFLLEHGADANADANFGGFSTALHLASFSGHLEAAQLMLKYDANIHVRNKRGQTPLHRVLEGLIDEDGLPNIFLDTIRCLLDHGADIDALDNDHATPLHTAAYYGCAKATRLLLEHGANVHLQDKEGQTPFQVASTKGWKEIAQLLLEHSQSEQNM
jgi:ankyrin repeat protein